MSRLPFAPIFPTESLYAYPLSRSSGSPLPQEDLFTLFANTQAESHWSTGQLALYLHIPFCLTLCQFCGFVKTPLRDRSRLDVFVEDLIQEIDLLASRLQPIPPLSSIYFGGGTPSLLSISQIDKILACIHKRFSVTVNCETTIEGEAITLQDGTYLRDLSTLGFKRLSFGVQTLDPHFRAALNLRPSFKQLLFTSLEAQKWFDDVNVDFIYGWPGQTLDHAQSDACKVAKQLMPTSIESFQFEALDTSPGFLNALFKHGIKLLNTCEVQQQIKAIKETLEDTGLFQRTFTKFSKNSQFESTYDACYYGWNEGQTLAVGRGSQSFYRGVMWGSALGDDDYRVEIARNAIPISATATYEVRERENVTWPRRGFIKSSELIHSPEIRCKIDSLVKSDLAIETNNKIALTDLGQIWVPSILQYLIPNRRQKALSQLTKARERDRLFGAISTVTR